MRTVRLDAVLFLDAHVFSHLFGCSTAGRRCLISTAHDLYCTVSIVVCSHLSRIHAAHMDRPRRTTLHFVLFPSRTVVVPPTHSLLSTNPDVTLGGCGRGRERARENGMEWNGSETTTICQRVSLFAHFLHTCHQRRRIFLSFFLSWSNRCCCSVAMMQ